MITLYDIPGPLPGKAWSPNTWKTRAALNFKGIPYRTVWIEYPEIEPVCKKIGATPTTTKKDGVTPHYTLPVIQDDSTGAVVSDSWDIAVYLDKTYPNNPLLFPGGTKPLQAAFGDVWVTSTLSLASVVCLPRVPEVALNQASIGYFRSTRAADFGKKLEDLEPKGEEKKKHFEAWEKQMAQVARLYQLSDGPNLLGETVSYSDLVAGSWVIWMQLVLAPEDWEALKGWHGGVLQKIVDRMAKYKQIL